MNIPQGYSIRIFRPGITGNDEVMSGHLLGEGPTDAEDIIEALQDYFDSEGKNDNPIGN